MDLWIVGRQFLGSVNKPVLGIVGEQVMDLENSPFSASVVGYHQDQFGLIVTAQDLGQVKGIALRYLNVQLISPPDASCGQVVP